MSQWRDLMCKDNETAVGFGLTIMFGIPLIMIFLLYLLVTSETDTEKLTSQLERNKDRWNRIEFTMHCEMSKIHGKCLTVNTDSVYSTGITFAPDNVCPDPEKGATP